MLDTQPTTCAVLLVDLDGFRSEGSRASAVIVWRLTVHQAWPLGTEGTALRQDQHPFAEYG
jgi:hypothetical protein